MVDRFRRTHGVWNWLPAFRAVGESLRLEEAAKRVGVSASALSRSVSLLEAHLGQALFVRTSRRLQLTPAGEELLGSTRDAMRMVDDGIVRSIDPLASTRFCLGASEALAGVAVAALPGLQDQLPRVVFELRTVHGAAPRQALLRGELDIALYDRPPARSHLRVDCLGTLPRSVFCAGTHPLATERHLSDDALRRTPFAVVVSDKGVTIDDGWPSELERNQTIVCGDLAWALGCAREARCVVAAPDHTAAPWVASRQLVRLAFQPLAALHVFSVGRLPLSASPIADAVREGLARTVELLPGFSA